MMDVKISLVPEINVTGISMRLWDTLALVADAYEPNYWMELTSDTLFDRLSSLLMFGPTAQDVHAIEELQTILKALGSGLTSPFKVFFHYPEA